MLGAGEVEVDENNTFSIPASKSKHEAAQRSAFGDDDWGYLVTKK